MTTKFYCDKCGAEFFDEEECEVHEKTCGIDMTKLHFIFFDEFGKKISSDDLDSVLDDGYDFIYIEDMNTFKSLNEFWDSVGYVPISAEEFEEKSIYVYNRDGWKDCWTNYTREIRKKSKQLKKMMAET